jgi:hypothetical protein
MNMTTKATRLFLALGLAGLMVACGGGGGGGGTATPAPTTLASAQADFGVSGSDSGGDGGDGGGVGGSAGDGSPIKRATVFLVDKNGVRKTGQTDDNGNFLINSSSTMTAPIIVKVIDVGGKVLTSVINENVVVGTYRRVMVNPLTDKIVSDSLIAGVPGTDKAIDGSKIDPAKIARAVADVRASVEVALTNQGVSSVSTFNPVTDKYVYNGQGVDAIIDSITHTRNPNTGLTELRSKLQSGTTDANGVIQPVLVTAAAPLATSAVLRNNTGELTFEKLNNFVNEINFCIGQGPANAARCDDSSQPASGKFFHSADYKSNGKDFDEDFITLCSETGRDCVAGSTFRNPVLLYTGQFAGSTATYNDLAIVEFTVRQPRTGPLAGNISTPIEYVKTVVFKRDDTLTASKAGNWIMHGNQRNFDWSVQTRYFTYTQDNPSSTDNGGQGRLSTGIRMGFNSQRFDYANRNTTRGYLPSDVFAVRLRGPGLPTTGIVFAPITSSTVSFAILNKTGVIPSPGTTTSNTATDFRIGAVFYPSGAAYTTATWQGTPSGQNLRTVRDEPVTDYSSLAAFAGYQAEIYTNANPSVPIVERTRNLAAAENPLTFLQRPLHDLSPSQPLITANAPTLTTSVGVQWALNPEAPRINDVSICWTSASFVATCSGASLPDRSALVQTATSVNINLIGVYPQFTPANAFSREVNLVSTRGRAQFLQSIRRSN